MSLTPRSPLFAGQHFALGTCTMPTSGLGSAQVLTWPQPLYTSSCCVVHFRCPEDIGILRTLSPLPDRAFYCILFIPRGTIHCQVPSLTLPLFSELPGGLTESSPWDFWKNKKQKILGAMAQTSHVKQGESRVPCSSGLREKEKHTEEKSKLHAQHRGHCAGTCPGLLFRICALVAAWKLWRNKYKHKEVRAVTQARADA